MIFYLNERSLHGQFESLDDFLESLRPVIKCLEIIHKIPDMKIYKIKNFYSCQITKEEKIKDLKGYEYSDTLMRLQQSLDKEIYDDPYWDDDPKHNLAEQFLWKGEDVTATSIAEAAVKNASLLSFRSEEFIDKVLKIEDSSKCYEVNSVHTSGYLSKEYVKELKLTRKEILLARYRGTRIDCELLEEKYGADILEKSEFELLISTLDKFVAHNSWGDIERDDGLEYKKYKPSSPKDNWFKGVKYNGKTIMKFRFSDVLRGFGYRKDDSFKVIRLERAHKVSDKG